PDAFEDLGHKLIVANAAWRLASLMDPRGRYATLRVGVWEMASYRGESRYEEEGVALPPETLLGRLIDSLVCDKGSLVAAHAIFLLDASLEAPGVGRRVRDYLTNA